jgi:hypothetical protein
LPKITQEMNGLQSWVFLSPHSPSSLNCIYIFLIHSVKPSARHIAGSVEGLSELTRFEGDVVGWMEMS